MKTMTPEANTNGRQDDEELEVSSRWSQMLGRESLIPTYVGIALVAVGFVLIVVAWGRVAGLADVAFQVPYIISAGFTGLGLIMTGVVVVNIAAKRRDAAERARQFAQLTEVMRELRSALEVEARR
jgi:hypothetical protein